MLRSSRLRLRHLALAALAAAGILSIVASGGGGNPPTPITTSISPTVISMGKSAVGAILPANCNDWVSSWNTPQQWWNSLRTDQPPRPLGQAVVGFDILFDTRPGGGCTKYRQDLYRAGFTYDLSQRQNLKGLVQKAEVTFSSFVLPSGVSPTGLCQPVTGGGGSLWLLQQGATLPAATGGFADLGAGPSAQPYPAAGRIFGMTFPWIAGAITQGVPTGVTVSTQATGLGGASFTADIKPFLDGALNRGDASMSFMISGSDEMPPSAFPAGPIDCKTVFKIDNLVIQHL